MLSCLYPDAADFIRRFAPVALAAVLSLGATSCQTTSETTGALAMATPGQGEADWRRSAEGWAERYRANPADPGTAINYAQALRATGQRAQAVAVLERERGELSFVCAPAHLGGGGSLFAEAFDAPGVDELVHLFGPVGDLRVTLAAVNDLDAKLAGENLR